MSKKIGKDWKKVPKGTKIHLKRNKCYPSFDKKVCLKKGEKYYISGFWANAMGLSKCRKKAQESGSDLFIASGNLKEFYRD